MIDIKQTMVAVNTKEELLKIYLIYKSYGLDYDEEISNRILNFEQTISPESYIGYVLSKKRLFLDLHINKQLPNSLISYEDFISNY